MGRALIASQAPLHVCMLHMQFEQGQHNKKHCALQAAVDDDSRQRNKRLQQETMFTLCCLQTGGWGVGPHTARCRIHTMMVGALPRCLSLMSVCFRKLAFVQFDCLHQLSSPAHLQVLRQQCDECSYDYGQHIRVQSQVWAWVWGVGGGSTRAACG
jgi:hypothetical protein